MPIFGITLQNSSSPEPKGQLPWALIFSCSIKDMSPTKVVQNNDDHRLILTFLMAR